MIKELRKTKAVQRAQKWYKQNKKQCIECGTSISPRSTRCRYCTLIKKNSNQQFQSRVAETKRRLFQEGKLTTPNYWLGKKRPKFSDQWRENMGKTNTGEKSRFWKGGITEPRRYIRACGKYKRWRETILERDNFTCQICKTNQSKLEVDHYPKSFAQLWKEHNLTNIDSALNCGELWLTDNGRTLCYLCHKSARRVAD